MEKYNISKEEDTKLISEKIGKILKKGDILLLYGDLGSGKTCFTRYLIQNLTNEKEIVPSPTFTIVQNYKTKKGEIWHYDLYRIKEQEELIEIGIYESLKNNITIIEWPQIIEKYIKDNYNPIILEFKFNNKDERILIKK